MAVAGSGSSRTLSLLTLMLVVAAACAGEARALSDGMDAAAAERAARKTAAKNGSLVLPLPLTPDTDLLLPRLSWLGLGLGAPVLIRVFKEESELEVWMQKDGTYVLFATYPVCYWSGALGPKLREGDKQTPEGFYEITPDQLHHGTRWSRSLDVGYPNTFDRAAGHTGSHILIHGGCNSVGCLAMTDAVNAEIYDLVSAALQTAVHSAHTVPVQIFPFRMSVENLAAHASEAWQDFWINLKDGYDSFERTRLPPRISVCAGRYHVEDAIPGQAKSGEPAPGCEGITVASARESVAVAALQPAEGATGETSPAPTTAPMVTANTQPAPSATRKTQVAVRCALVRASCRRWVALRTNRKFSKLAVGRSSLGARSHTGKRARRR